MDFRLVRRLVLDKLHDRTTYVLAAVVGTLICAYGQLLVPWLRADTNPFAVLGVIDQMSGDLCTGTLDPPVDDFSDFLRTNPSGRQFVHIANHDVIIEITLASGEASFTGSGTAHARGDVTGDGLKAITALILGEVSNGTVTKQASCKFIRSSFGKTVHIVRVVRLR